MAIRKTVKCRNLFIVVCVKTCVLICRLLWIFLSTQNCIIKGIDAWHCICLVFCLTVRVMSIYSGCHFFIVTVMLLCFVAMLCDYSILSFIRVLSFHFSSHSRFLEHRFLFFTWLDFFSYFCSMCFWSKILALFDGWDVANKLIIKINIA